MVRGPGSRDRDRRRRNSQPPAPPCTAASAHGQANAHIGLERQGPRAEQETTGVRLRMGGGDDRLLLLRLTLAGAKGTVRRGRVSERRESVLRVSKKADRSETTGENQGEHGENEPLTLHLRHPTISSTPRTWRTGHLFHASPSAFRISRSLATASRYIRSSSGRDFLSFTHKRCLPSSVSCATTSIAA